VVVDNLLTAARQPRPPHSRTAFRVRRKDICQPFDWASRLRLPLCQSCQSRGLHHSRHPPLKVVPRTFHALEVAINMRQVPGFVHLRVLRRSPGAPPKGNLLGNVNSIAPVPSTTNQALHRSRNHGLPPLSQSRYSHCPHLQYLRSRMQLNDGRVVPNFISRPCAVNPHRLRRRPSDSQLLLRKRRNRRLRAAFEIRGTSARKYRQPQ